MRREGRSFGEIAATFDVSRSIAYRAVAEAEARAAGGRASA